LNGEALDQDVMHRAISALSQADMLIIGGTSLSVYPAAGLIDLYNGNRLVRINKTETPQDRRANLILRDPIGQIFSQL
ncbi:MAG: NAD-dependent protein deacylase, partial [Clostridia bacterium]|nr:NAD-dependent protein deacylase [Clostridia bacterium]